MLTVCLFVLQTSSSLVAPGVDIRFNIKPLGLKDLPNMLTSNVSMQHLGSASRDVRVLSRAVHWKDSPLKEWEGNAIMRELLCSKTVTTYFSFSSLCDF